MARKKSILIIIFITTLLAAYTIGVFSAVLSVPVANFARNIYIDVKLIVKNTIGFEKISTRKFTELEYTFSDAEINSLIQIQSSIDISNKRGQLIQ